MSEAALDPYAVLGVRPDITDIELRRVYRGLVKRHHPDHNGGSAESARRFAEIQNAYAAIAQRRRGAGATASGAPEPGSQATAPEDPQMEDRIATLEREMAALNGPAPTDLRVNLLKNHREEARRALAAEGVAANPTPLSPVGLRLRERIPLGNLAAFNQGLIEVQDESSQIAALLADARPGMRVVDFCAGAGGKTLALASGMANRGKLVACEVSQRRLDRAARRLRRAGVTNVERRALSGERDKWVKHHKAGFDRVFADVPCLGTGTWRRNPDAKWRMRPEDLAELVERQQLILRSAARLARPGGRLIYATCSLLREEDEAQAEAFLAAEPDFSLLPVARVWRETIGGASPGGEDYLRLTPAQHGTDGFFVAIFERHPCQTGS